VGRGRLLWEKDNPAEVANRPDGDSQLMAKLKLASEGTDLRWVEKGRLILRRGPYVIVGGPDEAGREDAAESQIRGLFINLFDPELKMQKTVQAGPGSRLLLLDLQGRLNKPPTSVLASACKALPISANAKACSWVVEGITGTPAVMLFSVDRPVRRITLAGEEITPAQKEMNLLWLKFTNGSSPRELILQF
jgi:hypothetical protein